MPVEIRSELIPSNKDSSGPPTCPPERIEKWLKGKLEKAQADASEQGGQVMGFIIKEADVEIDDDSLGKIIASRDHLFIALEAPEPS